MKNLLNKEGVQNMLNHVKEQNPELKDFHLQDADGRLGKRIALAVNRDGGLYVKTDFMTYKEMNCFLMGYNLKSEGRFLK